MIVQDSWFITRFWDACIWCAPLSVSAPWCDWSGESQGRCRSFTVQVSEMNWNDMIIWDLRWICIICVYIYIIHVFIVYSLSLSTYIYIEYYIHICVLRYLILLVPLFVQVGRAAPDFSSHLPRWMEIIWSPWSSKQVTDIWGELEPGTAKTLLGFLRKFVVPPTPLLYHVFCHNWNCHLGSTSHFQTHSLHAAERCLFCGRNCLCKSLGRKHVAWGATREKVCGEIDFHCHKGRIRMVPELIP